MRELGKIITVKPEPETTPSLTDIIQKEKAVQTVSEYLFKPALSAHFRRIFDCVINRKGQGFWVQAEYGAGKTHCIGALVDLLVWREAGVWEHIRDLELKADYGGALSKAKWFPVAFSLRGMGQPGDGDSLMRVFEEQIRESIKMFAPELDEPVKITSAELADQWYGGDATEDEKAAVKNFFNREHKCSADDYRSKNGPKKFGQELVRSKLPAGRLRGKFKERFAYIYEQITKLGGYDGILFVVDEFRSWQDRHAPGTPAYAEDEEVLETLAYVLPMQHLNIITIIASQGDMPQKLSGGGEGDRFVPLYLLADKNKGDFGDIVAFRARELGKGAATDIKDYFDYCRKEYKFIKQANISLDAFANIFPFQPRCFEVMRNITQNSEKHNLPTARSAIRMAWQTLSNPKLLKGKRLITLADIIDTDELRKGLNHEHYRDAYLNLQGAIDQLPDLDVGPEERDQCKAILQTLLLWALSLPENLRDGLTAQEVAEAAWLNDDAVGAKDHAEHLLELLIQNGFPVRKEKKSRGGQEVGVYSYELSAMQAQPSKFFSPLKKKFIANAQRQDEKWVESLFWDLTMITPEAQAELQVNGGLFAPFAPPDQRSALERQSNHPPKYSLPYRSAASTRRVHRVAYGGEVVVCDRWRDEFGEEIKHTDQHFRLVYLTSKPAEGDDKITAALKDTRLRKLDEGLAAFVKAGPEQFGKGARSVHGFLRETIDVAQLKAGTLPGRVWVLVFDGMRFDSWETVVKPLLAEHFEVKDAPYFCVLPSFTAYARTGLLAGALPTEWKGYKGGYSDSEQQLFAINMGLTAQEAKTNLRFVTEADTTKARAKLAFTDKEAAPLNVLIYPVSDDACHEFGGDLASFNNKIRSDIVGNKSEGVRGILDDLLKRIGPQDTVVLTSDHGFVELLPGDGVEVAAAEAAKVGKTLEATVRWRYIEGFAPTNVPGAVAVSVGSEAVWMAPARQWFCREGNKDTPRYTHGGLSLAEVVIPGVVLRRVTAKEARAELVDLPVVIPADEDAVVDVPVTIRNGGNCEVEFELRVLNNLGEELLTKRGLLAPATTATETARVLAKYKETNDRETDPNNTVTAVTVRLRHTDLQGAWRDALDGLITVPVKVDPKPMKLETDALKSFDDI